MIKDVEPLLEECEETLKELMGIGNMEVACYVQGFINSINKLPDAEQRPHGEWIPCSERLPEEKINPITHDFEEVLGTTIWGDVRHYKYGTPIGHDEAHFWYGFGTMDEEVIAWMPLPEPYNGGEVK